MTTEAILLLALFAFLVGGAFFGDKGPMKTFETSGPRLAARIERHITTGRKFNTKDGAPQRWETPQSFTAGRKDQVMIPTLAASAILIVGVADDFRSRKFHNWLFLACSFFALIVVLSYGGMMVLHEAVLGFVAGLAIMLPLVLMKAIGAGDMKLLAPSAIVAGWQAVLAVAAYSLVWGVIFGLVQVALSGKLMTVLKNTLTIAVTRQSAGVELHRIPFTVAILVGWLTHLVYQGVI